MIAQTGDAEKDKRADKQSGNGGGLHDLGRDPLDVGVRIDELKQLNNGWLDGQGVALSPSGLDWLAGTLNARFPDDLTLPYLFPTPEGRVLAEWALPPWALSLEIDLEAKTGDWHALNLETGQEEAKRFPLAHGAVARLELPGGFFPLT